MDANMKAANDIIPEETGGAFPGGASLDSRMQEMTGMAERG